MHRPQQGSFQWEAIHSPKVPKVSSFGKAIWFWTFFPNFKVGDTVLVICNCHQDYTIEAFVVVIFTSIIWGINKDKLSINGSTTQREIPSITKTDCFPFFMAAWQLTKKLYNMIHKYCFTLKFYFCFTGSASSSRVRKWASRGGRGHCKWTWEDARGATTTASTNTSTKITHTY